MAAPEITDHDALVRLMEQMAYLRGDMHELKEDVKAMRGRCPSAQCVDHEDRIRELEESRSRTSGRDKAIWMGVGLGLTVVGLVMGAML
jgi:hypothetical protein